MAVNVEQKKQTILIVDDQPDNLALMGSLLKELYKTKVPSMVRRLCRSPCLLNLPT
jgi:CheY-like chemotaxis protein